MSPERFEIVVRGKVGPNVLAAIDGFDASYCTDGHTHLVGVVPDQARIHGLFQRLLDLHIELVSVNPVREDVGDPGGVAPPGRCSAEQTGIGGMGDGGR